jgi:hypothetical protein
MLIIPTMQGPLECAIEVLGGCLTKLFVQMCICPNLIAPVVQFLLATVYKFSIAKPRLQGQAWVLKISSQALDKGLAWPGLFGAWPGWAWAFRPGLSITTDHYLNIPHAVEVVYKAVLFVL